MPACCVQVHEPGQYNPEVQKAIQYVQGLQVGPRLAGGTPHAGSALRACPHAHARRRMRPPYAARSTTAATAT